MTARFRYFRALPGVVAVLSIGGIAQAAPITYVFNGTGSGTLGGTTFTNQVFSLTFVGDTDNVGPYNVGPYGATTNIIRIFTSTSFVIGSTTTSATGDAYVFDARELALAGFGGNFDLADLSSSSFSTYTLTTALAPTAFAPADRVQPTGRITTGAGDLSFTAIPSVSFRAAGGVVVPETSTVLLLGWGVPVISYVAIRRRRR